MNLESSTPRVENLSAEGFGKEDSVKETYQGFLSRSIRYSFQNFFKVLKTAQAVKKVFLTAWNQEELVRRGCGGSVAVRCVDGAFLGLFVLKTARAVKKVF